MFLDSSIQLESVFFFFNLKGLVAVLCCVGFVAISSENHSMVIQQFRKKEFITPQSHFEKMNDSMIFLSFLEYNILLNMHPEEYMKYEDLIQAYVFVHDPRSVTNPMAEGVTLKTGRRYKLYLTKVRRIHCLFPHRRIYLSFISAQIKHTIFFIFIQANEREPSSSIQNELY